MYKIRETGIPTLTDSYIVISPALFTMNHDCKWLMGAVTIAQWLRWPLFSLRRTSNGDALPWGSLDEERAVGWK